MVGDCGNILDIKGEWEGWWCSKGEEIKNMTLKESIEKSAFVLAAERMIAEYLRDYPIKAEEQGTYVPADGLGMIKVGERGDKA